MGQLIVQHLHVLWKGRASARHHITQLGEHAIIQAKTSSKLCKLLLKDLLGNAWSVFFLIHTLQLHNRRFRLCLQLFLQRSSRYHW